MSRARARSERPAGVTAAQLAEVAHPEVLAALLAQASKSPRRPGAMDPQNEIDRRLFRRWLAKNGDLLDIDCARVDLIHVLRARGEACT